MFGPEGSCRGFGPRADSSLRRKLFIYKDNWEGFIKEVDCEAGTQITRRAPYEELWAQHSSKEKSPCKMMQEGAWKKPGKGGGLVWGGALWTRKGEHTPGSRHFAGSSRYCLKEVRASATSTHTSGLRYSHCQWKEKVANNKRLVSFTLSGTVSGALSCQVLKASLYTMFYKMCFHLQNK